MSTPGKLTPESSEWFDADGYLRQSDVWDNNLATEIAIREGIVMTEAHWEIIHLVRDFYTQYNASPAIRILVKAVARNLGEEKGNSRYLFRLFPDGPAKQATKIAGLPKPVNCL